MPAAEHRTKADKPRSRSKPSISAQLRKAEQHCRERKASLTALRRTVLQIVLEARKPVRAYTIMKVLEVQQNRAVGPPTVYRALEFLLEHHLIQRIESQKAFIPIDRPSNDAACVLFICGKCGTSQQMEDPRIEGLLHHDAEALGFQIGRQVLELQGTCNDCQGAAKHLSELPQGA